MDGWMDNKSMYLLKQRFWLDDPLTYSESLRMAFAMELFAAMKPPEKFSEVGSAETPSFALSLRWTSTANLWKRLGPWLMTLKR